MKEVFNLMQGKIASVEDRFAMHCDAARALLFNTGDAVPEAVERAKSLIADSPATMPLTTMIDKIVVAGFLVHRSTRRIATPEHSVMHHFQRTIQAIADAPEDGMLEAVMSRFSEQSVQGYMPYHHMLMLAMDKYIIELVDGKEEEEEETADENREIRFRKLANGLRKVLRAGAIEVSIGEDARQAMLSALRGHSDVIGLLDAYRHCARLLEVARTPDTDKPLPINAIELHIVGFCKCLTTQGFHDEELDGIVLHMAQETFTTWCGLPQLQPMMAAGEMLREALTTPVSANDICEAVKEARDADLHGDLSRDDFKAGPGSTKEEAAVEKAIDSTKKVAVPA